MSSARRRAVTLVELLVSITVLLIILAPLARVFDSYYQIYGQNFSQIQCGTQQAMAKESIYQHLSELSALTVPEDNLVVFKMPVCNSEGIPAVPLNRNGVLLALYRSDATGSTSVPSSTGRYLWLGRGNIGAATVTPHGKPLARNITGLTFEYLDAAGNAIPRATRLAGGFDDRTVSRIRVTVTIGETGQRVSGRTTIAAAARTVTFTVAPRNNHD
jgi:hypothetical protein